MDLLKFLSDLVCPLSLKSTNSSSLSSKKYDEDKFTLTPRKRFQGHNTSMGLSLIEFTKPDTSN